VGGSGTTSTRQLVYLLRPSQVLKATEGLKGCANGTRCKAGAAIDDTRYDTVRRWLVARWAVASQTPQHRLTCLTRTVAPRTLLSPL
jgi:hypothetical protein